MTGKVYVVIASGGEYDEKWSRVRGASLIEDKANAYARTLIDAFNAREKRRAEHREWRKEYEAAHPRPTPIYPDMEVWPRWNNLRNDQITPEMRAERAAIKERNAALERKAHEPIEAWFNAFSAAEIAWTEARGYDREEIAFNYESKNTRYEVLAIDIIDDKTPTDG